MISVKIVFVFGAVVVGLLFALTARAQPAQNQTPIQTDAQTNQATEVKPTSTTTDSMLSQQLLPVSAPAETEPKEPVPRTETPASTVEPSGNAEDAHAVIDWLLDRSRRGR